MKKAGYRLAVILAIAGKDLREFSRDRLWMILTPLTLIALIALFLILPESVEESVTVGVFPGELAGPSSLLGSMEETGGMRLVGFSREEDLADAVLGDGEGRGENIMVGVAFPGDFAQGPANSGGGRIDLYLSADVPPELVSFVTSGIREAAIAGRSIMLGRSPASSLPVTLPELSSRILGDDMTSRHIPLKRKLRPVLLMIILMIESLALAGLVSVEFQSGTARAVLVTPVCRGDLLAAKSLTGMLLAVGQALIFLLVTGGIAPGFLPIIALTFLGALMSSSMGMITGALGRDFTGTLFLGILLLLPLIIPALSSLFPGSPSLPVRLLPSYGLFAAITGVMGEGSGWAAVSHHMLSILLWTFLMLGSAFLFLRRKLQRI